MPSLETKTYEAGGGDSEVVAVNGHEVVLEAQEDSFLVSLQPDASLSETWANIAPHLSRPKPDSLATCHHNIPSLSQALTHSGITDSMGELSLGSDQVDFIALGFDRHLFYWQTRGQHFSGKPEMGVMFKKFEPEVLRKLLSLGSMTIVGASEGIVDKATNLFKKKYA